jgi:hypothetical protein
LIPIAKMVLDPTACCKRGSLDMETRTELGRRIAEDITARRTVAAGGGVR